MTDLSANFAGLDFWELVERSVTYTSDCGPIFISEVHYLYHGG